jgi:hypothetical protein
MIFKTFAERKRLESRGNEPEVYVYDDAPPQFRHQICVAFSEGIGSYATPNMYDSIGLPPEAVIKNKCWAEIDRVCHNEIYSYLEYSNRSHPASAVLKALTGIKDVDQFLSIVEIGCICVTALAKRPFMDSSIGKIALTSAP